MAKSWLWKLKWNVLKTIPPVKDPAINFEEGHCVLVLETLKVISDEFANPQSANWGWSGTSQEDVGPAEENTKSAMGPNPP